LATTLSIVYLPVKPFVPVTATVFVSGVASCALATAGHSMTPHTIAAAVAAILILDMVVLPTRTR
jgi:hypothetical protein